MLHFHPLIFDPGWMFHVWRIHKIVALIEKKTFVTFWVITRPNPNRFSILGEEWADRQRLRFWSLSLRPWRLWVVQFHFVFWFVFCFTFQFAFTFHFIFRFVFCFTFAVHCVFHVVLRFEICIWLWIFTFRPEVKWGDGFGPPRVCSVQYSYLALMQLCTTRSRYRLSNVFYAYLCMFIDWADTKICIFLKEIFQLKVKLSWSWRWPIVQAWDSWSTFRYAAISGKLYIF